jgi:hypothetical protein
MCRLVLRPEDSVGTSRQRPSPAKRIVPGPRGCGGKAVAGSDDELTTNHNNPTEIPKSVASDCDLNSRVDSNLIERVLQTDLR